MKKHLIRYFTGLGYKHEPQWGELIGPYYHIFCDKNPALVRDNCSHCHYHIAICEEGFVAKETKGSDSVYYKINSEATAYQLIYFPKNANYFQVKSALDNCGIDWMAKLSGTKLTSIKKLNLFKRIFNFTK